MPETLIITPHQLQQLWQQQSGELESQRLVGFANAVLSLARSLHEPEEHPLEVLGLPTGPYNALRRAGLHHVEAVANLNDRQLMAINNIGAKYSQWIQEAVRSYLAKLDREASTKTACSAVPGDLFESTDSLKRQAQLIERAFYSMSEDRDRIAAVLIQVTRLIRDPGSALRIEEIAMDLMDTAVAA